MITGDLASSRGLHIYASIVAGATLLLIYVGGLVTSTGSGLAVPDWPLSYGMLMPPMVGGIFYEHGHRMVAASIGLLITALAILARFREPRRWVRRLAYTALGLVIFQGVLGGITVLFFLPLGISMAHACTAQTLLCLLVIIAVATSGWWRMAPAAAIPDGVVSRRAVIALAAVYLQLILGSLMRHMGAGLAITDFPLAMGRFVPPLEDRAVIVHFSHRLGAVVVLFAVSAFLFRVMKTDGAARLRPLAWLLAVVLIAQITLGAFTIWTGKAVIVTTFHVANGALVLALTAALAAMSFRLERRT